MAEIPHAPLSDALERRIDGREIVSAIFLTYKFDPAFFEQEVLPVLFDIPLSHASAIRLVQLEEHIRTLSGEIAVYYDGRGLIPTGSGSAKLDVRRIPVIHRTGVFHPKNIFLLLERNDRTSKERALLSACMSANLTRAGWWENVEVCHFEEVKEGDKTLLRDDLLDFLGGLKRRAPAGDKGVRAIDDVLQFLRQSVQSRINRSSGEGLFTRFYAGRESLIDFLKVAATGRISGANLEVISPYFDDSDSCAPLAALIDEFAPKEVRVHLPKGPAGEALCPEALFKHVQQMEGVSWARLPANMTKAGAGEDVAPRYVHAKVYRFFSRNPAQEVLLVGSPNLTTAAHQNGGNLETAFLVEVQSKGRPDFWLEPESRRPTRFEYRSELDEVENYPALPLCLRYSWDTQQAEAFWFDAEPPNPILLSVRGVSIGEVKSLPPRSWTTLANEIAVALRQHLDETSFVTAVVAPGEPTLILVQEEGMAFKPSLLLSLSVAEILRYWAMLTPAQRAAFIEAKWPQGTPIGDGADLVARLRMQYPKDTLFDRFAGFFHAFNALEKNVRAAVSENRDKDAAYRLFGKKYDSLPTLLGCLAKDGEEDLVERYVIVRCAAQLVEEIRKDLPEFWSSHAADAVSLSREVKRLSSELRTALCESDPKQMSEYLDWFDGWFMERAKALEPPND